MKFLKPQFLEEDRTLFLRKRTSTRNMGGQSYKAKAEAAAKRLARAEAKDAKAAAKAAKAKARAEAKALAAAHPPMVTAKRAPKAPAMGKPPAMAKPAAMVKPAAKAKPAEQLVKGVVKAPAKVPAAPAKAGPPEMVDLTQSSEDEDESFDSWQ